MTKLALLALALGACATTGVVDSASLEPRTKVRLDLASPSQGAERVYPALLDPAVPSVDRIAHSVRSRLGATATAELDLCTSPAGHVTKVEIAKTSSYEAFDDALVRDAEAWQFEPMPGPATVKTCRRATISYRPR